MEGLISWADRDPDGLHEEFVKSDHSRQNGGKQERLLLTILYDYCLFVQAKGHIIACSVHASTQGK